MRKSKLQQNWTDDPCVFPPPFTRHLENKPKPGDELDSVSSSMEESLIPPESTTVDVPNEVSARISRHSTIPNGTAIRQDANFMRVIDRNVTYLKSQLGDFFASRTGPESSSFVPVVCGSILFLYIINTLTHPSSHPDDPDDESSATSHEETDPAFDKHLPVLVRFFAISPGSLLFPYNWLWSALSIVTYPFVELYLYQVIIDVVVVSLSTTLIDPLWGRKELIVFFFTINVAVGVLSVIHYIIIYAVKGDAVYLYGVKIYGLTGYLAAVCVTVKQLLPDSVIINTSLGKMKNANMPLTAFLIAYLLYLLNLTSGVSVITFFYGMTISWLYLRFIQFHPTNGSRGDLSDSLAFATFFPNVMRPLVSLISDSVYSFLVKVKILPQYAPSNQSTVRVLSNRLTDNFKVPSRKNHKYHPSGDYEHLHQPLIVQDL